MDYEDECWEPGYDPGPTADDWPTGTCEGCGSEDEAVSPNGLCWDCEAEAKEDALRWEDYGDRPIDGVGFADPGGRSALRAATRNNPRNLPCPTCGTENVLTPADRAQGYQCDRCADACERGVDW